MFARRVPCSLALLLGVACTERSSKPPTIAVEQTPEPHPEAVLLSSEVASGIDFALRIPVGFAR